MPPPDAGISAENLRFYWEKRDYVNDELVDKTENYSQASPSKRIVVKEKMTSSGRVNLKYQNLEININIM